ncbi:rod shape-determining protein RodA [Alteromonas gracilis]
MSVNPVVERIRLRAPGLDWVLNLAALGVLIIGALLVWSATSSGLDQGSGLARRHLVNIAIGLVLFVLVLSTDHRWLRILTPIVYAGSVVGLVLVLVMGSTINGSRSWVRLAGMSIQPAEFAKLAVVIALALVVAERVESRRRRTVGTPEVLTMLVIAGIPAGLIMLQPDLGTVLVLTATVVGVLAVSGAQRRWLAGLSLAGVGAVALAVSAGVLKEYQLNRLLAFTDPSLDPRGAGYNTTQARIAIGNGGVFGEGLFEGSQTRAGFVPEQHTDFIFTVAGEELGLVGSAVLIALLGVVIWRAVVISLQATDMFGRLVGAGIACWFAFQAFQNIGMCLGIMPVTGVPLPFVSYGGSSMFATMMALGLLQNVHLRGGSPVPTRMLPTRRELARS